MTRSPPLPAAAARHRRYRALNLVGSLVKYLGPSALIPAIFAVAYHEPVWPFLAAGAIVSGFGIALERLTHGAARSACARATS